MTETRYVTPSGRTVVAVEAEHPRDWTFVIDGKDAVVRRFMLYRDGGTRRYVTSEGEVLFPHRLGSEDRTPRLDREPLTVEAEEPDRLVALRNSMRGADVPVALFGWMQEVERRFDVLRGGSYSYPSPFLAPEDFVDVLPPERDRVEVELPGGRKVAGDVLLVQEVSQPVNGDDNVTLTLPVPSGVPVSRVAVMLVKLDDPPPVIGDDVGLRFEDEYPDADH